MAYTGFLSLGGNVIANAARTVAYVQDALPQLGMVDCTDCDDLRYALQDPPYTSPIVDQPDWFDPYDRDSWDFFGFYPLTVDGLDGSVRTAAVTELAVDGAVVGAPRRRSREIRVTGLLIGRTDAAVAYGLVWLERALEGSPCRDQTGCTGDHLCYYAACPPMCTDTPGVWEDDEEPHEPHWIDPVSHGPRFYVCGEGLIANVERACAIEYERTMYQVTCTDGPRVIERYDPSCGAMMRVEFTLVAGVPWAYSTSLRVAGPDRLDEAPYVFDEISCEPGSSAVVRRNLARNPIPVWSAGGGWAPADPQVFTVTGDTQVHRLDGDASVRSELLRVDARDNLAVNPEPVTLDGWDYLIGQGPAEPGDRTNLWTNPRPATGAGWEFSGQGAALTDAVNVMANPGLRTGSAFWCDHGWGALPDAEVLRTNHVTNPRGWSDPDGVGVWDGGMWVPRTGPVDIFGYRGATRDDAGDLTVTYTQPVELDAGDYTVSVWVNTAVAATVTVDVAGVSGQVVVPASAEAWLQAAVPVTLPGPVAGTLTVTVTATQPAGGGMLNVTGLMAADGSAVGFFDGDTPSTATEVYQWTGQAHASTSIALPAATGVFTHTLAPVGAPAPGVGMLSKTWTTDAVSPVTYGVFGPDDEGVFPEPEWVPGLCWDPVALPGTDQVVVSVQARGDVHANLVVVGYTVDGLVTGIVDSPPVALDGLWRQVAVTTSPAALGNPAVVQVLVAVSDPSGLLTAGAGMDATMALLSGQDEWFDGDTADMPGAYEFGWAGERGASPSTRTALGGQASGSVCVAAGGVLNCGGVTLPVDSTGPDGRDGFLRLRTDIPAPGSPVWETVSSEFTFRSGSAHTVSLWVRANVTTQITLTVTGGGGTGRETVTVTGGSWRRVAVTWTIVQDGPDVVRLGLSAVNQAGGLLDAGRILWEEAPGVGSYFDGSMPDTANLVFAWTGVADSSTSTLTVRAPQVTTTLEPGPGPVGPTGFMRTQVVVPKAGGFSGPRFTTVLPAGQPTGAFTLALHARSSQPLDVRLHVEVLDDAGTVLQTASGPLQTLTDWEMVGPVTIDITAEGATRVRVTVQSGPDQVLAAGATIDAAGAMLVTGRGLYSPVMAHFTRVGAATSATGELQVGGGLTYTVSVYVASARPAVAQVDVRIITPTRQVVLPGPLVEVRDSPEAPVGAMRWQRLTNTFQTPANATAVVVDVVVYTRDGSPAVVGDLVWATNALLERSPEALSYFDGTFPDSDQVVYGWEGAVNASVSTLTLIQPRTAGPLLDPDCPPLPSPPRPPAIEVDCLDTPTAWRRYVVTMPPDVVPVWRDAVPVLRVTTGQVAARQVRVRFYPNPNSDPIEALNPCDFCGEVVISYIPPHSTMTIDGTREWTTVESEQTGDVQVANHLVYGSDGGPMTWPLLSCGIPYTAVMDISPQGVADATAELCLAARA